MASDDRDLTQPPAGEPETVGRWLAAQGLSGRTARERLHQGRVWDAATPVKDLGRPTSPTLHLEPNRPQFDPRGEPAVVAREPRFVVVYKPSGVLSVPAPGRREPSVVKACERWFGAAFAVHRIDEGTSGLLVVALDEPTQARLKDAFEVHAVERAYLAIVRGTFPATPRTVRSVLVRDRGDGLRGSAPEAGMAGKEAVTHLRLVEARGGRSLVEARLETGRTHQVRIHLAEAGFPLLGDDLYGRDRGGRLALHAHVLGFAHPWTGAPLRWVSPLPDDLRWGRDPRPEAPEGRAGTPRPEPKGRPRKHR
jgi:23S rRNA pseudouridine1911/1915/1917 synthase